MLSRNPSERNSSCKCFSLFSSPIFCCCRNVLYMTPKDGKESAISHYEIFAVRKTRFPTTVCLGPELRDRRCAPGLSSLLYENTRPFYCRPDGVTPFLLCSGIKGFLNVYLPCVCVAGGVTSAERAVTVLTLASHTAFETFCLRKRFYVAFSFMY